MALDAWFPVGFPIAEQATVLGAIDGADSWQIVRLDGSRRALVVTSEISDKWLETGLVEIGQLVTILYGDLRYWAVLSGQNQVIAPVAEGAGPGDISDALSFAAAMQATRSIDHSSGLQDAIYVEKITRLLPTYTISPKIDDALVLGYWLTGGANVSAKSFRRLSQSVSWIAPETLRKVIATAGLGSADPGSTLASDQSSHVKSQPHGNRVDDASASGAPNEFLLAGRPALTAFFNEHVLDILRHRERYKALGIDFPSPVVLHGPPGCGKTFAVEKLVEHLGWPSFQIDASSVASPYIHETSRKVAQVFEQAREHSPSVLIIDEMEAFLADRDMGEGHHRVEEVAEFLRRIPEAASNEVLILAMTNRIEMIDPAILRRGRFDHVIAVDFATAEEVQALVTKLLSSLPVDDDVSADAIAGELAGRPLSDVAFVVREAARLSARAGRHSLSTENLLKALHSVPPRDREGGERRKIGFG